ncbi:protein N-terminal glutamine amidohydrolase [Etheostoma spectabile]|uniref:protein N-terminal glutamine amidohydrolase n=1 Tax=Etheostoma spectabile TaxID=54343 RepID=UPI0013AEA670|nr:protein N-terminal glutamine amidohydrolase [Etheostoma spectabile]
MKPGVRITPSRENCVYTSCYCEENVWKLCEFVRAERSAALDQLEVVFISNETRTVPLWRQKSGRGDQPVIWDYHVILLQVEPPGPSSSSSVVYDLDSELEFPCSLELYAAEALHTDTHLRAQYHRKLRVIPADCFLLNFASDRSHMKNSDGSWKMPPPAYPPIQTAESQMNLDDFISVSPAVGWGGVFSLDRFLQTHGILGRAGAASSS